jgi:hypothetical protein
MKTASHPKPQAALGRQRSVPQDVPPHPTMKRTLAVLLLALLTVGSLCPVTAQVTFTRVTEGDLATDIGRFSGVAWGDYDDDGYVDLFVTVHKSTESNRLYRNNGDGTFSRITTGIIVTDLADGISPIWGDLDNDGHLDLFVSYNESPRPDRFYRNNGDGTFTRITEGAWVNDSSLGVGAAWIDYDNDGLLDLFVGNALGPNFLYRNQGDGTMAEILGSPVNISGDGVTHGLTCADYDNDGYLDLFVTGQSNTMFRNNGDGTFTLVTAGAPNSRLGWDMGVAAGDYNNDGCLDLIVVGMGEGGNRLFRNDGAGGFTRITDGVIASTVASSFSGAWGDYDNDGYLDLFIANLWGENNSLFRNNGDGTFSRVTQGAVVNDGGRSLGCAWADYDNDGYLDLIVANGYEQAERLFLYRNDGGPNHWLVLRLVGVVSNRSAIGAKVRILATIRGETFWQMREISGGSGYGCQNDLRAHFGLGDADSVDTVLIEWPSGVTQMLKNVAVNQHLVVEEDGMPTLPSVVLSFSEGGGLMTLNRGAVSGNGQITRSDGLPAFAPTAPKGLWTPLNNVAAMDFGLIADGQGGRAIDCGADLGTLEAFTICGWLNARDLTAGPGGNRIVSALASSDGPGFEFVQREDGSLQLGVNQTAVDSPVRSVAGRITEDAEAPLENWVFFAVTYDGTQPAGNAQFYFGTSDQAALPDSDAVDYPRGEVAGCGQLALGNVSRLMDGREDTCPAGSRVFRGLLDEVAIFGRVLELEEIQATQRAPARRAAFTPVWTAHREGNELVLEWDSARPFQVQECSTLHGRWIDVRGSPVVDGFRHTFRRTITPTASQRYYRLSGY